MNEVEQILSQIKSNVDRLMRLSFTIRNPAPHEKFKIEDPELLDSFLRRDIDHVQNKFPGLHAETGEKLGKALTHRRFFFRYREQHHMRLTAGLDEDSCYGESRDGDTTEASWLPKDKTESLNPGLRDDLSELSATSYAPSSATSSELRVPPIPRGYNDGPFQCPFCWLMIEVQDRYQWK